ncbi:hypothetical protein E2C01_035629 [Portunus trituberculatus]|uniref:Uncharacterized protein n=1 Tax=Portunus trituberculatus TaxID=210409 RepID=A0A5B7F8Y9_PORTR|nr:hypothetical protein [Portunus trituberculatus]
MHYAKHYVLQEKTTTLVNKNQGRQQHTGTARRVRATPASALLCQVKPTLPPRPSLGRPPHHTP